MGDRGHNRHGLKRGEAGALSNTMWREQIWAEHWGWAVPLWGGEGGSPSNTV